MTIRIVRLGSPRHPDEGLRIGTVRRPPRGVPKAEYATRELYDVWLPNLAPSEVLLKDAQAAAVAGDERSWKSLFSVGCYCADEARCHRSVLRALLEERGARLG
jgi:uncharacterized protein YeaO (DUF488 family)